MDVVRRFGYALLMVLVASMAGPQPAVAEEEATPFTRGIIVPAPRPQYPRAASAMNKRARSTLESLGYQEVPQQQAQEVLARANVGNTARCLDKTLMAIGRTAGADLVVCPRMVVKGGKYTVRVRFARVSKKRVWSCERPLDTESGASAGSASEDAVAVCMDQLLSSAPKRLKEEKKEVEEEKEEKVERPKRKRRPKNHYLGAAGLMVPFGRERFTAYYGEMRYSKHFDHDFSGGFSVFYERRKAKWVAFGAQFDFYPLRFEKLEPTLNDPVDAKPRKIDRLNLINLGASLRFLYPGEWVEPYLKVSIGLTVAGGRDSELYDQVVIGAGFGANYQLRVGLMATFPYVGAFFEVGMVDVLWFPNVEDSFEEFDSAFMMEIYLTLNLGLVVVF